VLGETGEKGRDAIKRARKYRKLLGAFAFNQP